MPGTRLPRRCKQSNAELTSADANVVNAKAELIRADERRKDKLLKLLIERGIDLQGEVREDLLRIAFLKNDDADTDDHTSGSSFIEHRFSSLELELRPFGF